MAGMSLKIITLIEDSPGKDPLLLFEHGLSFYIEKDGRKLLFDTGQSGAFLSNAERLQVNLPDLEYVALSHGHYDHSGGFRDLCEYTQGVQLILGRGFFNEKYSLHDTVYTFKGNNFNEEFLLKKKIPYRMITGAIEEILPDVFVVTDFPRNIAGEKPNPRFQLLSGSSFIEDSFTDEILIVIDTPEGLVVLVGCSHPGIINMLEAVKNRFNKPLYAVFGGTHLVDASEERIVNTVDYFRKSTIQKIGACHCTGEKAIERLRSLGDRFLEVHTGSTFYLD